METVDAVDADMGVVAAEVVVVVVGVGEARTGEFRFESGSLRVVAFEEEEEEAEDVVDGVCRCEVWVGVGCWFVVVGSCQRYWLLVVGCWLLLVHFFVLMDKLIKGAKMEGGPALAGVFDGL